MPLTISAPMPLADLNIFFKETSVDIFSVRDSLTNNEVAPVVHRNANTIITDTYLILAGITGHPFKPSKGVGIFPREDIKYNIFCVPLYFFRQPGLSFRNRLVYSTFHIGL